MDRSFNMESLPDGWGDSVAMQSFIRLKKNALGVPSSNNTHTGRNSPTNRSKSSLNTSTFISSGRLRSSDLSPSHSFNLNASSSPKVSPSKTFNNNINLTSKTAFGNMYSGMSIDALSMLWAM